MSTTHPQRAVTPPSRSGSALQVDHLRREFPDAKQGPVIAVDDVSFEVEPGAFYTLLGPSGCGKTTTLRSVAGLEEPTEGRILIGGDAVYDRAARISAPAYRRDIGMVFQNYGVWPHMTVFENVAFPLRVGASRVPRAKITSRVTEALATVQLAGYEKRMATALSGGQQQRLSLARALARRPKLLLLDEPLSNLDAKLREAMRSELRALQRRLGITTLYVTHDQGEALSMSTRIAVMREGRIVQEGSPRDIYDRPANSFVSDFVGRINLLDATAVRGGFVLAVDPDRIRRSTRSGGMEPGDAATAVIRPESILLHEAMPADTPAVEASVRQTMFLGEMIECRVELGSTELLVRLPPSEPWERGQRVWVELPEDPHLLPREDEST